MSAIWLVRHAPTLGQGVCYGQSDVAVTLEPVEAARAIGESWTELVRGDPPEIWTSPWARTQPVAEELARRFGVACQVDARLSELSFGAWEGRAFSEIERTDSARFQRWMRAYEVEAPPSGETAAQLRARVAQWLEERRTSRKTVLAVSHAGVIRMGWAIAGELSYSEVAGRSVPHLLPQRIG
ncbi:MAG: histidine phosphatase family protein [Myxococcales bacterium]